MHNTNILIGFDSTEGTFKAVDYTGDLLSGRKDVTITLLFVERLPNRDFYGSEEEWRRECEQSEQLYRQRLDEAKKHLVTKQIPEENISEEYLVSCSSPFHNATVCSTGMSIVDDIMRIQEEGGYGTVVVARRGVSKSEAFLFGSVSNRIIQETKNCTVWVVG